MKSKLIIMMVMLISISKAYAMDDPSVLELNLPGVLKRANQISVKALLAEARVQGALARVGQARSVLLPQFSGVVTGARQTKDLRASGLSFPGMDTSIGPYNTFDARGRISQTIFDLAAVERLRAARMGEKLSRIESAKAQEDVLALAASMYIDAKRAREHCLAMYENLRRDWLSYKVHHARYQQGIASSTDFKEAEAILAQSRYAFEVSKSNAIERILDLKALLKITDQTKIVFAREAYRESLGQASLATDPGQAYAVETAQAQFKLDQVQLKAAKADYGPRISLFGDYGRSGQSPDHGSNTYLVGLQATIPIWEGGLKAANLDEARARLKQSKAQWEDSQYQSDNQIVQAWLKLKEARLLIVASLAKLVLAQEMKADMSERVDSGMGSQLDLATVNAQLTANVDAYKEAVAIYWLSKVQLAHAKGQMKVFLK